MHDSGAQVTQLLSLARDGDSRATDALLPLVYEELRRMARAQLAKEQPGVTLQPTMLVHEAYLRLVGDEDVSWTSRGHFFGAAAQAMRRILVDRARTNHAAHNGHGVGIAAEYELPTQPSSGLTRFEQIANAHSVPAEHAAAPLAGNWPLASSP